MPPKKRVREDEEDEAPVVESSAKKKSRAKTPAKIKAKTPSKGRKTPAKAQAEEPEPEPRRSRRTAAPAAPLDSEASDDSATPASSALGKPSSRLASSSRPMTPPSPEEPAVERGVKDAKLPKLDDRFAMVDDTFGGGKVGLFELDQGRPRVAARGVGHASHALLRLLLPGLYLASALALLLVATGTIAYPATDPYANRSSRHGRGGHGGGGSGFGRPARQGEGLVQNVTAHLRSQLAPLVDTLALNSQKLASENQELDLLEKKISRLESEKSQVKRRLENAVARVDRVLSSKASVDPRALRTFVEEATVELETLELSGRQLEDQVRGHLEDIAKHLVTEAQSGGAKSPEGNFFSRWIEQSYQQARPDTVTFVPKAKADALIKQHFQTFTEAECSGLHDLAGIQNGARVVRASKTFVQSSGWLGPWTSGGSKATSGHAKPEAALSRGNQAGQCWPMAGTSGMLEIELANAVKVSSIALMHIHPKLAPGRDVSSAPKNFTVLAYPEAEAAALDLEDARAGQGGSQGGSHVAPIELLSGTFDKDAGCATFEADPWAASRAGKVRRVALQVTSNWGRPELTCLYRFMVHGAP